MRIPIVLSIGLTLTALAVAVTMSHSPLALISATSASIEGGVSAMQTGSTVCQSGETLPAGTTAIRFPLGSPYGPSIRVEARSGARVLTEGARGSEWVGPTAVSVTPVVQRTFNNVTVCFKVGAVTEGTTLTGAKARHGHALTINGHATSDITRIEYLRPGPKSWASLASTIANHMGLGNASGGSRIVFLLIVLMAAIIAIASRALIGDLR